MGNYKKKKYFKFKNFTVCCGYDTVDGRWFYDYETISLIEEQDLNIFKSFFSFGDFHKDLFNRLGICYMPSFELALLYLNHENWEDQLGLDTYLTEYLKDERHILTDDESKNKCIEVASVYLKLKKKNGIDILKYFNHFIGFDAELEFNKFKSLYKVFVYFKNKDDAYLKSVFDVLKDYYYQTKGFKKENDLYIKIYN